MSTFKSQIVLYQSIQIEMKNITLVVLPAAIAGLNEHSLGYKIFHLV